MGVKVVSPWDLCKHVLIHFFHSVLYQRLQKIFNVCSEWHSMLNVYCVQPSILCNIRSLPAFHLWKVWWYSIVGHSAFVLCLGISSEWITQRNVTFTTMDVFSQIALPEGDWEHWAEHLKRSVSGCRGSWKQMRTLGTSKNQRGGIYLLIFHCQNV